NEIPGFALLSDQEVSALQGADQIGTPTESTVDSSEQDSLQGSEQSAPKTIEDRGVKVDLSLEESFDYSSREADGQTSDQPADTAAGDTSRQAKASSKDSGSAAPSAMNPVSAVGSTEATQRFSGADQAATARTVKTLNLPDLFGAVTPSPAQLQQRMQQVKERYRGSLKGGDRSDNSPGSPLDELGMASPWLIASNQAGIPRAMTMPAFRPAEYNPAVLYLRFTPAEGKTTSAETDAFLDLTLIPSQGEVEGQRVEVSMQNFSMQLRDLFRQLSRQDRLDLTDPASPSRSLHQLLFGSITPSLEKHQVSTLLIAADRGLQAVPFAALSDGQRYFGDRYAFAITPSLALTDLKTSSTTTGSRLLALGASEFDGLAALPLVPQELANVGRADQKDQYLNKDFTPSTLLVKGGESQYNRLHVATHAEFKSGGPAESQLHSGVGPISMTKLAGLRQARQGAPLDLVVFSACRTALGDPETELGFTGLALQAGARSAVGTLWYVDDVVTSAYFVQMYRYLEQGIPKAEALQFTRRAFIDNLVRLEGDQVIGVDGTSLLTGLSSTQQRRMHNGLQNPFFWAGIELLGSPW
ncbi:MAG: CHAT domain-containing protein, partial [Prochlorococcus sp.]